MLTLDRLLVRQGAFELRADWQVGVGITAVIGPSGGGKSTLLAAIAGFAAPVSGQVHWQGQDLTGLPPARRGVSLLFQDSNLFPHLTVARNLGLGLTTKRRLNSAQLDQIDVVLDRVGLAGMGGRRPSELSGGQQSRAALARVLLEDNPLVLLDEPFAALGPGLRSEMAGLVSDMLADRVVLMVTHEPRDALDVAGQVIFVDEGQANAPVDARDLIESPTEPVRRYLRGAIRP